MRIEVEVQPSDLEDVIEDCIGNMDLEDVIDALPMSAEDVCKEIMDSMSDEEALEMVMDGKEPGLDTVLHCYASYHDNEDLDEELIEWLDEFHSQVELKAFAKALLKKVERKPIKEQVKAKAISVYQQIKARWTPTPPVQGK